jgi:hypothetical protein
MAITYDTTTGLRALLGGNLVSDIDTGFLSLAQDVAATLGHAMQEGVKDAGSFEVTQASGGASLTLDIASNVGTGAFVQNDGVTSLPLVYLPPTGSKSTVTVSAAHATLPRVDSVYVTLAGRGDIHRGHGDVRRDVGQRARRVARRADDPRELPSPRRPARARDGHDDLEQPDPRRRRWARGAYRKITRNADAGAGDDYTISTATLALLDGTNLNPRIECSGVPVRVTMIAALNPGAGADTGGFSPQVDSVGVDGMPSISAIASGVTGIMFNLAGSTIVPVCLSWTFTPTAGSHLIGPSLFAISGSYDVLASVDTPMQWVVEEIVRQDRANDGGVTSG